MCKTSENVIMTKVLALIYSTFSSLAIKSKLRLDLKNKFRELVYCLAILSNFEEGIGEGL